MKKALITGISGFVGPYLEKKLILENYKVFGLDRLKQERKKDVFYGDITDKDFIMSVIETVCPDEIYHLAGFSSVKKSFERVDEVMAVNVGGTRNLLEAASLKSPKSKILIVSSADVYGNPNIFPISEKHRVKALSPYARSRIEQEKLANDFKNLFIVISRSFNHTGPGQSPIFVLSDFTKQVIAIEKGLCDPVINTGDLSVIRDFSDVRDVVNAYHLLLKKGKRGETYNVGSGKSHKLIDLLQIILSYSNVDIEIKQKQSKIRLAEISKLVADITKIKKHTGWQLFYSIDQTLNDLLNYWRNKL